MIQGGQAQLFSHGEQRLVKVLVRDSLGVPSVPEIDIMCRIRSPFLMRGHCVDWKNQVGISMKRAPHTLSTWLQENPSLDVRWRVFIDVVKGIMDLHRAGYLHLDIKPNNIVCWLDPEPRAMLIDFGFAAAISFSSSMTSPPVHYTRQRRYTVPYVPPESIRDQKKNKDHLMEYFETSDSFTLGVLLMKMMCSQHLLEWFACRPESQKFILVDRTSGEWGKPSDLVSGYEFLVQDKVLLAEFLTQSRIPAYRLQVMEDLCRQLLDPNPQKRLRPYEILLHPLFHLVYTMTPLNPCPVLKNSVFVLSGANKKLFLDFIRDLDQLWDPRVTSELVCVALDLWFRLAGKLSVFSIALGVAIKLFFSFTDLPLWRSYNPFMEKVCLLEWDGVLRCSALFEAATCLEDIDLTLRHLLDVTVDTPIDYFNLTSLVQRASIASVPTCKYLSWDRVLQTNLLDFLRCKG